MKLIRKDEISFNRDLFHVQELYYLSCSRYWDGGYDKDATLSEKAKFYSIASQYSEIIKDILISFSEPVIISSVCSENERLFEKWKDIDKHDSYNNLISCFHKKKSYMLDFPNDIEYIDYIVENNFRYLSCIDLFLQQSNIIIQPTCHTEVFIYSYDYSRIIPIVKDGLIKHGSSIEIKKYYNNNINV